jgi:molybdopterin/thiamine biosynthesis adenylyltransferase
VNPSTNSIPGRDARQQLLVPAERLARCVALVIGVGAIGRQVALPLAALGVSWLILHDDDQVEAENLAAQGYWPEDLQQLKVHATAQLCQGVHPPMQVAAFPQRFKRSTANSLEMAALLSGGLAGAAAAPGFGCRSASQSAISRL